ncbi:MAG: LuxR C-terminal-related transcriptional regulator [Acidimicrobiia bacterium]
MIRRSSLVDRIVSDPPALTLFVAPPGYGKSELLAQVVEAVDGGVAWLTLDPYDDDPTRFWTYLLAALEPIVDGSLEDLRLRLRGPQLPLPTSVVEPLVVRLGDTPVTIVIDDYQLIGTETIHESLQHLVRHLPSSAHLVLSSRTQPPFTLGRARLRSEIAEVRAHDLALDSDDTKRLLETTADALLPDSAVTAIHERTEGWAAGVYLAGLSLRQVDDIDAFVADFAGDDRNVAEYLATEVVGGLDEDTRVFLREAAVLDELRGPLCDDVLERSGSRAKLSELASANMLLIPVDRRNESFRFHHIFRDWLRLDLDIAMPGRAEALHRRAMAWYSSRDSRLAGHHAVQTGDPELAVDAMVRWGTDLIDHGELVTVRRWAEAVPEGHFEGDPSMAVMVAWMSIGAGRVDEIEPWLELAERADAAGEQWQSDMSLGDVLCLRAYRSMLAGDIEAAARQADRALELVKWLRGRVAANLHRGVAAYWLGDERAATWLTESARDAEAHPEPYALIQATAYLGLIALDERRTDDAALLVAATQGTIDDYGLQEFGQTAVSHYAAACLALDAGALDDATVSYGRALELAERIRSRPLVLAAVLGQCEVAQVLGNRDVAGVLLGRAIDELAELPSPGSLAERVAVVERRHRGGGQPAPRAPFLPEIVEELTDRELAVLRLLPSRLTQREIGDALFISMNTVKTHTRNIFRKLSAGSRDEAVEIARSVGLL